ncbi:MAG: hypothetical protein R3B47_03295 [Bacteroidia bacterium]
MEYYFVEHRTDDEVGNVYPQVTFDDLKEAFKFRHNVFPIQKPILLGTLEKGAKLTEILSQGSINGHGLLISEKVKSIFAGFQLMDHKYFECPIKDHSGALHQYYWLALVQIDLVNLIDFENSSFYLKKGLKNLGPVDIKNYDHYLMIKAKLDISIIVKAKSIHLRVCNLDLFKLPLFDNKIYVSSALESKMAGIRGIQIRKYYST